MSCCNKLLHTPCRNILVVSCCRWKVVFLDLDERLLSWLILQAVPAVVVVDPLHGPGHPLQPGLHLGPVDRGGLGAEVETTVEDPLLSRVELIVAIVGCQSTGLPPHLPLHPPVFLLLAKPPGPPGGHLHLHLHPPWFPLLLLQPGHLQLFLQGDRHLHLLLEGGRLLHILLQGDRPPHLLLQSDKLLHLLLQGGRLPHHLLLHLRLLGRRGGGGGGKRTPRWHRAGWKDGHSITAEQWG